LQAAGGGEVIHLAFALDAPFEIVICDDGSRVVRRIDACSGDTEGPPPG
jgi:hypothetical protein